MKVRPDVFIIKIMEIKGKIYCFFEQSGTFKNEFRKLGYEAEDYDIQNEYGETDHICDLFAEIEAGYDGKPSIFDEITPDDLVLAFFPCIYFCEANTRLFRFEDEVFSKKTKKEALDWMLERNNNRAYFWSLALKLFANCDLRGLRLIVENPFSTQHYLYHFFPYRAAFIDKDRTRRGDSFVKPTQYYFVNCEPTTGLYSEQKECNIKTVHSCSGSAKKIHINGRKINLCNEKASLITSNYARNFICDFIIGKVQDNTLPTLF